MKLFPLSFPAKKSGFTLIELLVVIAIIAILASVISVAAGSAIASAKRSKASNTATQIQTAILAYNTEYGVYPVPTGTTTDMYYSDGDSSQQALMFALCGNINASTGTQGTSGTVPNTRQIAFLTPRRGDVDNSDGILISPFFTPTNALTSNGLFNIVMDSDYSGIAGDSGSASGKMPDFNNWKTGSGPIFLGTGITQPVAVWCDCDQRHLPPNEISSTSPGLWAHTY